VIFIDISKFDGISNVSSDVPNNITVEQI